MLLVAVLSGPRPAVAHHSLAVSVSTLLSIGKETYICSNTC